MLINQTIERQLGTRLDLRGCTASTRLVRLLLAGSLHDLSRLYRGGVVPSDHVYSTHNALFPHQAVYAIDIFRFVDVVVPDEDENKDDGDDDGDKDKEK